MDQSFHMLPLAPWQPWKACNNSYPLFLVEDRAAAHWRCIQSEDKGRSGLDLPKCDFFFFFRNTSDLYIHSFIHSTIGQLCQLFFSVLGTKKWTVKTEILALGCHPFLADVYMYWLSLQGTSHAGNSSCLWRRKRVSLERKEPFLSMPVIFIFFPMYMYELLKQLLRKFGKKNSIR